MQFRLGRWLSGKAPACDRDELNPLKARCGRTHLSPEDSYGEIGGPSLETCEPADSVYAVGDSRSLQLKVQIHA